MHISLTKDLLRSKGAIMPIAAGQVLQQRFVLDEAVGEGGMGTVLRGRDLHTGSTVAVKVLRERGSNMRDEERFQQEARVLADLQNPGIVAHVAHGQTPEGLPYLVMEWLAGEDLAQRLRYQPLTARSAIVLMQGLARALGVAHAHGIVHRDLKPSNIFLRDGQVHTPVIIDFGIAKRRQGSNYTRMTQTGILMGTPEYMAPEQARGQRSVSPATDIFSLGCILFECLTGRAPFSGDHIAATLVKILFESPPPLQVLRPDLPESLARLIERMLAKEQSARYQTVSELLEALTGLEVLPDVGPSAAALDVQMGPSIRDDMSLVSVVVATARREDAFAATIDSSMQPATRPRLDELRGSLLSLGASCDQLADGSLVATLVQGRSSAATDLAASAARCALLIKERWPTAVVVIATGPGALNRNVPIGTVIDRAGRNMRIAAERADGGPLLDGLTARLLGPSFITSRLPQGGELSLLEGERSDVDESRRLLGKPTPCVGRDPELGLLDTTLNSCIEESQPVAVLVVAPAGVGKSRLRHEFLRRVEARGQSIEILLGRGDPMSAGALYGLLGQALRRLCCVLDGESAVQRQQKLAERIGRYLPPGTAGDVVPYVGEICSIPFSADEDAQLKAARSDPKLMSDRISFALLSFLRAECSQHPVLLVMEDLHWGDVLTAKLLGTAITELTDSPLMVLALARPEVKELFPKGMPRCMQERNLPPLSRKASERLVKEVLGKDISADTVARIVRQADGNAFYLEELIRVSGELREAEQPETVLAMLQMRIGRLPSTARLVLRAAAVFGEVFWRGGVGVLVNDALTADRHERDLDTLLDAEFIVANTRSRIQDEQEYSFRHALVREAAYGLLSEQDRRVCHARAAEYLQRAGETDPLVLAEHYDRSGDKTRALEFMTQAALQALEGNDLSSALARAAKAINAGASGASLSRLRGVQAWANFWSGNLLLAFDEAREAVAGLPPGSFAWCSTMGSLFLSGGLAGKQAELAPYVELLVTTQPTPDSRGKFVEAASSLVSALSLAGARKNVQRFLVRIDEIVSISDPSDMSVRGWAANAQNWFVRFLEPDPWRSLMTAQDAMQAFAALGDRRMRATETVYLGLAQWDLGEPDRGEATLREALDIGLRLQEMLVVRLVRCYLPQILIERNDPALLPVAEELLQQVLKTAANTYYAGLAQTVMAQIHLRRGDVQIAEQAARQAVDLMRISPSLRCLAYASLIHALLHMKRAHEATDVAMQAAAAVDGIGGAGRHELPLWHAAAQAALQADSPHAGTTLRRAVSELTRRADKIPNATERQRFLQGVPVNAQILALAQKHATLLQG